MSSVAASRLVPHRWPASRYKDLLLGLPLATSGRGGLRPPCQDMSFQPAGMRAGAPTCDPDAMLRCLLVDDSPLFLDAARGLLERQGITVVAVASTSADALRRAVKLRPDVTLVDLDLGGESGLELARRLHRLDGLGPVPVILISTHAEQDYAELIAASPAVGFLSKAALSGDAIRELLAGRGRFSGSRGR
jgi:CheY-like chemotaxis protein